MLGAGWNIVYNMLQKKMRLTGLHRLYSKAKFCHTLKRENFIYTAFLSGTISSYNPIKYYQDRNLDMYAIIYFLN